MRRRDFIQGIVGPAVTARPFTARAQQSAIPVVGFVREGSADGAARFVAALRKGLNENGYVDGQNVTVEYHWLEGQYDLPALMADVVRRRVAVIATPGNAPSLAAKAATCNGGQRRRARLVKTDAPAPARVFRFNDPQAA